MAQDWLGMLGGFLGVGTFLALLFVLATRPLRKDREALGAEMMEGLKAGVTLGFVFFAIVFVAGLYDS